MSHKENPVPGNGRGHLDQSRVVRLRCVDKTRIRCTLTFTHAPIDSQDANACKPNTKRGRGNVLICPQEYSRPCVMKALLCSRSPIRCQSVSTNKFYLSWCTNNGDRHSSNNIKASNVWTTLRHWQNQGENDGDGDQEEEEVDGKFAPTRIVFR